MNADQICVLDGGAIVERGTHEQLLELENGIYAKLVQRQLARKQNLIEEEGAQTGEAGAAGTAAPGGAKAASPRGVPMTKLQREASEQAKKAAAAAVDNFDSLFDEQKEQEQQTKGSTPAAVPAAASNATAAPRSADV